MPTEAGSPYVYYYSGDKAYIQGYTIEARELFIRPYFEPNADPSNPIYMTVSQEAHYRINPKEFLPVFTVSMGNPYDFANQPPSLAERLLKFSTGFILDGRMTTERRFYPQVYPYTGELMRNEMGFGERLVTSEPDIKSSWTEDLYIQVGSVFDPLRNRTPDIASMFEYYYYELNRDSNAYSMLFPSSLVVDLHIWINPLVKFIWFGTTLFFLSGLIVLLPIIELKNKE
jgi:cytochrome c-type biogenesis protein CcmF